MAPRTPTPIQFPDHVSRPADVSKPSFLTKLPAEIRNMVYDVLYHRDEPVLLHDGTAYREQLFHSLQDAQGIYENVEGEGIGLRRLPAHNVENYVRDDEFDHGYAGCMSLLRTCRQVYHEAAGTLYGSNKFLFSRVLDQECHGLYDQTKSAVKWITSIGSQISLVSKILIDADALCPATCHMAYGHQDILPLLRIVWANPGSASKIVYAHTGRKLDDAVHPHPMGNVQPNVFRIPIQVRNNLLQTLGYQDALDLKRYVRFERVLPSILVSNFTTETTPLSGWILYHSSDPRLTYQQVEKRFDILAGGASVHVEPQSDVNFMALPWIAHEDIISYVCNSGKPVVFDLDKKVVNGLQMSLLSVNRRIRMTAISHHDQQPTQFVLKMATHDTTTDFNKFQNLKRWAGIKTFEDVVLRTSAPEVLMDFVLTNPTPFEDLRIEVNGLVHIFDRMSQHCQLIFRQPDLTNDDSAHQGEVRFTWGSLHKAIFMLLSEIFLHTPSRGSEPLPDLWISGEGKLLHATYVATTESEHPGHFQYDHAHLHPAIINAKADRLAAEIVKSDIYNAQVLAQLSGWNSGFTGTASDSLLLVWGSLYDTYRVYREADVE